MGNRRLDQKLVGALAPDPYEALLTILLCTVAGTSLLTILNTLGIQSTANNLVATTWKVLYTTTANEHDGVFLQVVSDTWNVSGNFDATGKAHTCDLTQSRVWLLRGGGVHTGAHATAHWVALKGRGLGLDDLRRAALADQLLNSRHFRVLPLSKFFGNTTKTPKPRKVLALRCVASCLLYRPLGSKCP